MAPHGDGGGAEASNCADHTAAAAALCVQPRQASERSAACAPSLPPQVLVESEVLLALAPHLSAGLELTAWDLPSPGGGEPAEPQVSAEEAQLAQQRQQQRVADLVGRLGAQLAQCSSLKQLFIQGLPAGLSLDLATGLLLAPQLQLLRRLTVTADRRHSDETSRPAAAAVALAATLTALHRSRPDAAASRVLHVTTNLVSEQGAQDLMWALGRVGAQGVRVVYGAGGD